jgi:hypothetical protein
MELATTNDHEPPTHLGFCLLCCCATKTTSSRSSTCICDRESRSLEPSSSTILHRERANKVFGKRSSRLLARFFKFFIMAHLPLRRTRVEGHRLQRKLRQADRHLHPIVIIKEPQITYGYFSQMMSYILNMFIKEPQITYGYFSQIMSYILNMFICRSMILLNNLLQCLLLIAVMIYLELGIVLLL